MTTIALHSDTEVIRTGGANTPIGKTSRDSLVFYATRALWPLERDSVSNSGELPKTYLTAS